MNNETKQYAIGLDLGGTNSVFGIVDQEGNIVAETSIKTQGFDNADDYFKACMAALLPIIEQVGGIKTITHMGIGAPNGNINTGSIEKAPNIAWAHECDVPLAKMFSDALGGLSVKMTNDANAAALGEMTFGVAKGMQNFIMLTLGTGVGGGVVCNGQLVAGHDGMGGELGHLIVRRHNARLCGCGRKGCLETYCSATGVMRTTREMLESTSKPSVLREKTINSLTTYDVAMAAEAGDELAKEIYDFTGKILGEACADMMAFTSPEAFVFFGGLSKAGDLILNPLKKSFEANVMTLYKGKPKFLMSTLDGAGAAVLGAASLK